MARTATLRRLGATAPRTLLLAASGEPLTLLAWRRALRLVATGKAEVVAPGPAALRSPSTAVAVPSVLRLHRDVTVPVRRNLRVNLANLLLRDAHRCAYCGGPADTIDHVVPRSRGGTHVWENVVAACRACNVRKADRLLAELGWTLPVPPRAPRGSRWLQVTAEALQPEWLAYLHPAEPPTPSRGSVTLVLA